MNDSNMKKYWQKNLRLIVILLTIWAMVSLGAGIILAKPLSAIQFGGLPLSFWFAQQGSIITFVILVFTYAWRMDRLDKEFDVQEYSMKKSAGKEGLK
ncbi:DUF4212 domain-containing protein [Desulfosporosinus burensis]